MSIVYIEGSQAIFPQTIVFLSLKIDFVEANSADPDEMRFHLDIHCLTMYPFIIREVK